MNDLACAGGGGRRRPVRKDIRMNFAYIASTHWTRMLFHDYMEAATRSRVGTDNGCYASIFFSSVKAYKKLVVFMVVNQGLTVKQF